MNMCTKCAWFTVLASPIKPFVLFLLAAPTSRQCESRLSRLLLILHVFGYRAEDWL